jgi:predicted restriction endonuclease
VSKRTLDTERWYVHRYDSSSGTCLLIRGIKPSHDAAADPAGQEDDKGPEDKRHLAAINVRRVQPEFREKLLAAWERRCVVTVCRIAGLLEAAHITPHSEATDFRTSNGLLLRADIHTLFDLGLLSIDEHLRVHLAEEVECSEYLQYQGKRIDRMPERSADAPSHEALAQRHAAFVSRSKQQPLTRRT